MPPAAPSWPALPAAAWAPTRDTLHRWTQIVGKTALALRPFSTTTPNELPS